MVETHGGGRHYIPDGSEMITEGSFASLPVFRSVEDSDRLLVLAPLTKAGVAPLELERTKLDMVKKSLSDNQVLGGRSIVAELLRDGTVTQDDVAEVKLYNPLIPGDVSTHQHPTTETLAALAEAMFVGSAPISNIPAAYTYFGQFLAHDMSYMALESTPNGKYWVNKNAFHALQFNSLFGTIEKPGDPSSDWVCHAGTALGKDNSIPKTLEPCFDLPRNVLTGKPRCKDPRADSNLALAQMHVLLVRFHQKLAIAFALTESEAKRATKQHLQAVVLTDYLQRIIPCNIYDEVMCSGRRVVATDSSTDFLIPLEFAAAVFRFGHSMIQNVYSPWGLSWPLGQDISYPEESASLGTLLHFTSAKAIVSENLEYAWGQFWRHWVGFSLDGKEDIHLMAARISTQINRDFRSVPRKNFPDVQSPEDSFNLPFQTLVRGAKFLLPSGQELANLFGEKNILNVAGFLKNDGRFSNVANDQSLQQHTPLWFFTLAEAEVVGSGKLGPVAARTVMETFHAALSADQSGILDADGTMKSFVDFESMIPTRSGSKAKLTLEDIVRFTYGPMT